MSKKSEFKKIEFVCGDCDPQYPCKLTIETDMFNGFVPVRCPYGQTEKNGKATFKLVEEEE